MRLVDTHCHLNDPEAFPEPAAVIGAARAAGVDRLIVVGVEPESCRRALAIAEAHEGVFAIVGWHPNHAADYTRERLDELEHMLAHPKVVALGEIGLDYHWDFATPVQQVVALRDQLALAERLGKPVVFHCREAYDDLLDLLEARPPGPWLFHCFAGDREQARRASQMGCYFGVDGPVTYKSANALRETLRTLPQDRLVIETDSPYMTPVPFRGKPNQPAYVKYVNAGLASALALSEADCAALTTANAERFFGI